MRRIVTNGTYNTYMKNNPTIVNTSWWCNLGNAWRTTQENTPQSGYMIYFTYQKCSTTQAFLLLLNNYSIPHNLLFKPHRQSLHKVVGRNVFHCYSTKRHLKWKQRCTFTSTTPEENKVTDMERSLAYLSNKIKLRHFTLRKREHVEAAHAQ